MWRFEHRAHMVRFTQGRYHGGSYAGFQWGDRLAVRLPEELVEQLGLKEGDELKIVAARTGVIEVETRDARRRRAVGNMRARQWILPPDYKFDRDEANER